ncbi:rod shape-determining protein RodA [Enterobacteriaceae endosymbiont of Donacia bicoloricornis]|uniref:rod shape-determining protein RodA n=1 Tax=Enterobacteriaceae endosymbiont of Donacia bicoloricornis TaxID=2675772 RepID=UPI00144909E1|nr:rod shape-determining protein RodA [Enterobacteriaceae endosymbiont of Donacia bicoloricornis]QJC37811.1 rod shape-determining protein RodA [Enterobacteriaceae endosymbiont of Donacia bicoloricornis]
MKKKNLNKFIHYVLHTDTILLLLIIILLTISLFITWSSIGSKNHIYLKHKIIQICIGFITMLIAAQIPPHIYKKYSFLFYFLTICLLIAVKCFGSTIKGAQRWLHINFITFQPSEIAKISVPLIVSYILDKHNYHILQKTFFQIIILILIPTILVAKQPDLGTAILISLSGAIILFLAGLSWKRILNSIILFIIFLPFAWIFLLHDYQRERMLMLLQMNYDLLGKGYHIFQSKIAISSGGLFGKGWKMGTQAQLNFLPEKHTDFIFSVFAEEFGFIGVLLLIFLYLLIIVRILFLSLKCRDIYNQLIINGIILIFFLCIFVNISMVSGLLPVVGIPLPILSYGGTSLVVIMASFGIIMSMYTHNSIIT